MAFDRETDRYIVSHNLMLKKSLHLESFYEFKLQKLRLKWSELIKLANENAGYLLCNDTFIDLLKFLIDLLGGQLYLLHHHLPFLTVFPLLNISMQTYLLYLIRYIFCNKTIYLGKSTIYMSYDRGRSYGR